MMFSFKENFNDLKNGTHFNGMCDDFFALYVSNLLQENDDNILIVTSTLYEANKLFSLINNYTNNCLLFPMDDFLTSESIAISPELKVTRLETINKILDSKNVIITNLNGYLRFLRVIRDKNVNNC